MLEISAPSLIVPLLSGLFDRIFAKFNVLLLVSATFVLVITLSASLATLVVASFVPLVVVSLSSSSIIVVSSLVVTSTSS